MKPRMSRFLIVNAAATRRRWTATQVSSKKLLYKLKERLQNKFKKTKDVDLSTNPTVQSVLAHSAALEFEDYTIAAVKHDVAHMFMIDNTELPSIQTEFLVIKPEPCVDQQPAVNLYFEQGEFTLISYYCLQAQESYYNWDALNKATNVVQDDTADLATIDDNIFLKHNSIDLIVHVTDPQEAEAVETSFPLRNQRIDRKILAGIETTNFIQKKAFNIKLKRKNRAFPRPANVRSCLANVKFTLASATEDSDSESDEDSNDNFEHTNSQYEEWECDKYDYDYDSALDFIQFEEVETSEVEEEEDI